MTSPAPGAHPPPEEVDALLDPSGGDARVSAHVEDCERCGRVRDDLRAVRALLGAQARSLPPEPADLGARIAAALAAEPPLRPGRPVPDVPAQRGWDRSEGGQVVALPTRRRRWPAYLAVAASVAVVGLGGTYWSASWSAAGPTPAPPRRSPPPSRRAPATPRLRRFGRRCRGARRHRPARQRPRPGGPGARRGRPVLRHRLHRRRPGRPGGRAASSAAPTGCAPSSPRPTPSSSPATGREDCLARSAGAGEPAATDVATYEGQQAVVLVLASGRGYDVLVVPVGCGSGDDRVLAETRLR